MGTIAKYALLVFGSTAFALILGTSSWIPDSVVMVLVGAPFMLARRFHIGFNILGLGSLHPALGAFDMLALYFANLFIPAFLFMETQLRRWAYLQVGCLIMHFLVGYYFARGGT